MATKKTAALVRVVLVLPATASATASVITIATAMGMNVEKRFHPKGGGRPSFVGGRGKPIMDLLA